MYRVKVIKLKRVIALLLLAGAIAFCCGIYKKMNRTDHGQSEEGYIESLCKDLTSPIYWSNIILSNQLPGYELSTNGPAQGCVDVFLDGGVAETPEEEVADIVENEHTDAVSEEAHSITIHLSEIPLQGDGVDSSDRMVDDSEAQVLIYHTHTREAYRQSEINTYKEPKAEPYRCDDLNYTVVQVGNVLSDKLKSNGIKVIHDNTEHEQSELGTAYTRSLLTVQEYVSNNPNFNLLIDLHRDAYPDGAQDDKEYAIEINGQRYAKFFVLIGTGEGKTVGFSEKPNWEKNYQTALALTTIANNMYPGIADDVLIKTGRYNQHVADNMILIEVGSNYTTLEEAERTAEILGEIITQWLSCS